MPSAVKAANARMFVGQREVATSCPFMSTAVTKNDTERFLKRKKSSPEGRPGQVNRCKSAPKSSSNTTRPLNKSSSCTGFACLAKQQGLHFPPPKAAWADHIEVQCPETKKITVVLPKTHKKKIRKPIENAYFNGILNEKEKAEGNVFASHVNKINVSQNTIRGNGENVQSDFSRPQQIADTESIKDGRVEHVSEEKILGPITDFPGNSKTNSQNSREAHEPENLQSCKSVVKNKVPSCETRDVEGYVPTDKPNECPVAKEFTNKTEKKILETYCTSTIADHCDEPKEELQKSNIVLKDKTKPNIKTQPLMKEVSTVLIDSGLPDAPRQLRSQQRFSGYKPQGQTSFVPFTQMFTKTINQMTSYAPYSANRKENSGNDRNEVKLTPGIESLTPKDKDTIQRTRQLLRQQVEAKDVKKKESRKIPLSIVLTPQPPGRSQDSDDKIFQTIEQKSGVPCEVINARLFTELSGDFRPPVDNTGKNTTNNPLCSAFKISKKKSIMEIHTQVSRASPVSSDVEILPVDILDSKNTKSTTKNLVLDPRSPLLSEGRLNLGLNIPGRLSSSKDNPRVSEAQTSSEDDGEDILSPTSGRSTRNSCLPSHPQTEESINNHRYQMVTDLSHRSSTASMSSVRTDQTRQQSRPATSCTSTKGRAKPESRRQRSSPVVYLPDQRCFAGVQEALALQARLARAQVTVSINTLLRGLLSPPQYRQLQLCPVLKVYAGC